jgi:uncharacterized protein UPF0175
MSKRFLKRGHGGIQERMIRADGFVEQFRDLAEVRFVAEKDFNVSLPPEVVGGFGWNESEVPSRVREALVMELLRLDKLSEAQALAILKLARWELLELMGRYDVPAVRMSAAELDRELATEVKRNGST